jgi:hypothetical protein
MEATMKHLGIGGVRRPVFLDRTPVFLAMIWVLFACGSDLGFRRFEVGPVEPLTLLQNAVEVTREFYTRYHGGLGFTVDEDNLSFETGYVVKKTELDFREDGNRVQTGYTSPLRQKLYFRVVPAGDRTAVEYFATFEVMSIDDPDRIETPDDIWRFVKQDTQVEDLLHEKLLQRLVEKGILP